MYSEKTRAALFILQNIRYTEYMDPINPIAEHPETPNQTAPPPSASPVKPKNWLILSLIIPIALLKVMLFCPVPYYQTQEVPCTMGQTCPKPGWHFGKSLFQNILSWLSESSRAPSTPPAASYACPVNGWVDCMPIMDEAKKKACSPEAMTWYKANCPNFKGGAL
jgi:hypothetical protein